ncbi:MAG TPA: hypothetical protein VNR38_04240 [Ureibacillus sp.]|nr:hypothetical protein [Ureibacillus sp.]
MRYIKLIFIVFLISSILAGCSDFSKAISGIDHQAQKAASALSSDALNARTIKLEYKNESFSIDELFTTILRDIFWEYEKNNESQILIIKGTWKKGLFGDYEFTDEQISNLQNGKVTVKLEIFNGQVQTEKTVVQMTLDDLLIIDESGEKAQVELYEAFFLQ